ncbi:RNA polymerase subunit sigma [Sphingomonas spermidinifaciens]|uniref:RNA polymerase subunit sigma n=1 Tax=Sphingomonas spermidinifaciens TaxID=1141889 RepID=A0A2A4B449_9SPHN|nr:sigma-70 family RNA polymerase sigma factor [Sphingomonas spermidinifaciens]PCD02732.1 RNA polymerase subunit sigma [Sphingomonas spermidinifaciens]
METADLARARLNSDIALAATGDRAAFARIYQSTSHKLFGIVVRMLHDREAAEEVLQEVYLKIWDRAGSFEPGRASPITWMATIARNSAIDSLRRRDRRRDEPEAVEGAPDAADATDPDVRIGLVRCMDLLDEHQRQFIRSAFFEGYSYSELAHHAAVPLGTMKSWIRRGLERLRYCLDGE